MVGAWEVLKRANLRLLETILAPLARRLYSQSLGVSTHGRGRRGSELRVRTVQMLQRPGHVAEVHSAAETSVRLQQVHDHRHGRLIARLCAGTAVLLRTRPRCRRVRLRRTEPRAASRATQDGGRTCPARRTAVSPVSTLGVAARKKTEN